MPIKRIFWDGNSGRDIHVLRGGTSRDLTHALKFVEDNDAGTEHFADDYLVSVGDVTLTFTPLFRGTPQNGAFVGAQNGITVSQVSGFVSVDTAVPARVKRNFIIEVEARNNTGTPGPFREAIRVHVHGSVADVWVTPEELTIPLRVALTVPLLTAYRFAVHAQFDDGVVGDLTDGHDVTWSEPGAHMDAEDGGGITILPTDVPDTVFPVTVTLPTLLGGATSAAARIRFANTLSASGRQLTLVAGGPASAVTVEDAVNVLMVSDGFRGTDEPSFDRIVDGLVHHLRNNQLTSPFNLLAGRMNFWKLFTPATQIGLSIRGEVVPIGIKPHAMPVPPVRRPPDTPPGGPAAVWNVSNLMYAVGLPVRGDEARPAAALRAEWTALHQTDPGPHVTDDEIEVWKMLAKRTLVDEVDDFPGLALGSSAAASNRNANVMFMHPNRVGSAGLRAILATLGSPSMTLADGQPVGALWRAAGTADGATTNAAGYAVGALAVILAPAGTGRFIRGDVVTFAGDPNRYVLASASDRDVTSGGTIVLAAPGLLQAIPASEVAISRPFRFRSGDFIVLVSALRGGRSANSATNSGRTLALTGGKAKTFPFIEGHTQVFATRAVPGRNALALDPGDVPASAEADVARTLAHELAHSMGLGDEYVEFNEPFADVGRRAFGNLQREADAQIVNPTPPPPRILHGNEIQWNWHRITAAAVVNGPITFGPALDVFRIPVIPDVSFRFAVGDVLRLRVRRWGQAIGKLGPVDVSEDVLVAEPPSADAIVVRFVLGAISAQRFPPGSLVYRPKLAPASVQSPQYPYAEMVAKNVKDTITRNRLPLLDAPGPNHLPQLPLVASEGGRTPVPDLSLDAAQLPRIVGLYPGGLAASAGIFHPTGQCMMRDNRDAHAEFCAVCRYVLVDLVAPDLHPEIDAAYDKVYPQK